MILIVLGGPTFARDVYSKESRGYWSAALPLVLEKHGFLDFEVRTPEEVDSLDVLRGYDCVLVGRIGAGQLPEGLARALLDCERPVLLESPQPSHLSAALGISGSRPAYGPLRVRCGPELTTGAQALGLPAGGRVAASRTKPMERPAELDWRSVAPGLISEARATAWGATGWDVERWTLDAHTTVLADYRLEPDGEAWPAVATRGWVTGIAFSLFAYLGQAHTSEPCSPGEWRSSHRTAGMEGLLLALVDRLLANAGAPRTRVLPWPGEARWVLNIRHDFDRPIGYRQIRRVLHGHRAAGTRATWYWRARHLGGYRRRRARLVARTPGHEVALHTDRLFPDGTRERRLVERAIRRPVAGTSAHGAPDCFRYQGAPNVLWADEQRMLFTELIQHAHMHPHRFANLTEDGRIEPLRVICLPHHVSFDASTLQGATLAARTLELQDSYVRAGGMFQVMNHPDLHPEELFGTLARLTSGGRLDLTASAAASWWRRTHAGGLLVTSSREGRPRFRAEEEVLDLQIERRQPNGEVLRHRLDLPPGETVTLGAP
jgi:hypothetical protein